MSPFLDSAMSIFFVVEFGLTKKTILAEAAALSTSD